VVSLISSANAIQLLIHKLRHSQPWSYPWQGESPRTAGQTQPLHQPCISLTSFDRRGARALPTTMNRASILPFPRLRTPASQRSRGQSMSRPTGMLLTEMVLWAI
jgi:hypothetical protein